MGNLEWFRPTQTRQRIVKAWLLRHPTEGFNIQLLSQVGGWTGRTSGWENDGIKKALNFFEPRNTLLTG